MVCVRVLWLFGVLRVLFVVFTVSHGSCVLVRIRELCFFVCLSMDRVWFCLSMSCVHVSWVFVDGLCIFSLSILVFVYGMCVSMF